MGIHTGTPNGDRQRGTALLILPYFGTFGPWFPLYLRTLEKQHTLDLLLLTDGHTPALPGNARRVQMTFAELRERASAVLDTPVRLHRTRNICDLRPAYGLIFAEFLKGYPYWAFGDEDVIYGDLDRMLAPHLDGRTDLISPGLNGKSGHLTLVRNAPVMNELAMRDPVYKDVLVSTEHWAYDETSWRWGTDISSFDKIAREAETRGELTIHRGLRRAVNVPKPGRWYVHDGRSLRDDTGSELLYYHWGRMRHRHVQWPDPRAADRGFAFDRYGFYDPQLGRARLLARRALGFGRQLVADARRRLSETQAGSNAA